MSFYYRFDDFIHFVLFLLLTIMICHSAQCALIPLFSFVFRFQFSDSLFYIFKLFQFTLLTHYFISNGNRNEKKVSLLCFVMSTNTYARTIFIFQFIVKMPLLNRVEYRLPSTIPNEKQPCIMDTHTLCPMLDATDAECWIHWDRTQIKIIIKEKVIANSECF